MAVCSSPNYNLGPLHPFSTQTRPDVNTQLSLARVCCIRIHFRPFAVQSQTFAHLSICCSQLRMEDVQIETDQEANYPPEASPGEKRSREGKIRSKVWHHFTKILKEDGKCDKCQCNHCQKLFTCSSRSGTTHLLRGPPAGSPDHSISAALSCLNEMQDIPQSSEMYLDAFEILQDAGERECFICLPPEPRRRWLQRMLHRRHPLRYSSNMS
ncbi:Unknown protein [Striga hermonthica]|uniref:BED-type domain-containing protein n=1 Tax=Striga hermonthica TaxID=68872 RepID=A0A9N7R1L3_STRHE|nr:Unknown protein [Striga hermonthica]